MLKQLSLLFEQKKERKFREPRQSRPCPICGKKLCSDRGCAWATVEKNKLNNVANEPQSMTALHDSKYQDSRLWNDRAEVARKEWRDRDDFFVDYREYLKSDEWRKIRKVVLKRDGHLCQVCGHGYAEQVHHINYSRVGMESTDDLISICNPCHDRQHGR